MHGPHGPDRYRVDGSVVLENNVYIGSRSLISGGVRVGSSIQVGAGTVVSKSLTEKAMYVSQGLRVLPLPPDPNLRRDLSVDEAVTSEIVFTKSL